MFREQIMNCLVRLLIFKFCIYSAAIGLQRRYKAAVVEYAPILTAPTPMEQFTDNINEYKRYIQKASKQNVDIIIFPEDGLTGWGIVFNETTVDELSTEVPHGSQNITPCTQQNADYSKGLIDLSCFACQHNMYVLVNLVERRQNANQTKRIYHNTNVVFDRSGTVIARYRKINLFNEDVFEPGSEAVTFRTDFGVKFGVQTCFDIMFKNPGLELLKDSEVTDIAYAVAWFSELPFLQALSIQHGYVTSTGVNFLSAGMHDPTTANGGSAIYLSGGTIAESYISDSKKSKMIIHTVPIITERGSSNYVEINEPLVPQTENLGINSFLTYEEDMSNYTLKTLNLNKQHTSETICNADTNFCCLFEISVTKNLIIQPNYVYKLAVFHGSRLVSLKDTVGVRNCGIVACLNSTDTSCGGRHEQPPRGVIFTSISINGTFSVEDSHDQPATLNHNLKPASGFKFGTRIVGNKKEVEIHTTKVQHSFLTFGIYGRVFSNDNKPTGTIPV